MRSLIRGLLFGVALFSSAAHSLGHYPPHAHSTETTVTVHVIWLPDLPTVDAICAGLSGEVPQGGILACYSPAAQTIFAVEPTSFNDLAGLAILGHEFWHALGAKHPD